MQFLASFLFLLYLSALWNGSRKDPRNNTSIKSGLSHYKQYNTISNMTCDSLSNLEQVCGCENVKSIEFNITNCQFWDWQDPYKLWLKPQVGKSVLFIIDFEPTFDLSNTLLNYYIIAWGRGVHEFRWNPFKMFFKKKIKKLFQIFNCHHVWGLIYIGWWDSRIMMNNEIAWNWKKLNSLFFTQFFRKKVSLVHVLLMILFKKVCLCIYSLIALKRTPSHMDILT